jgi:hypothetical protein
MPLCFETLVGSVHMISGSLPLILRQAYYVHGSVIFSLWPSGHDENLENRT